MSPVGRDIEGIVKEEPAVSLRVLEVVLAHEGMGYRESCKSRMLVIPAFTPSVGVHETINTVNCALGSSRILENLLA